MKCHLIGCVKKANVTCSYHKLYFCANHYIDHCLICKNQPIRLDNEKEIIRKQSILLSIKIVKAKGHIIKIADSLIKSINISLQKTLDCLDKQRKLLEDMIQMKKPKSQIKELLDLISAETLNINCSFKGLLDADQILNLEEFKKKVNQIENKYSYLEVIPQKNSIQVSPVYEFLEKLDINERITWFEKQNIALILDRNIKNISFTSDGSYVFICEVKIVCKIKAGKINLDCKHD